MCMTPFNATEGICPEVAKCSLNVHKAPFTNVGACRMRGAVTHGQALTASGSHCKSGLIVCRSSKCHSMIICKIPASITRLGCVDMRTFPAALPATIIQLSLSTDQSMGCMDDKLSDTLIPANWYS